MILKHAGIFAAGAGARLGAGLKSMAPVQGHPLCHWVAQGLIQAGARHIVFLTNSRGQEAQQSLAAAFTDVRWTFLTQDTASSWESFRLVAKTLAAEEEPFALSTVDALIDPAEIRQFLQGAKAQSLPAALALTEVIDDEKPLWADVDARGFVTAVGVNAKRRRFATAGMYYLTAEFARSLPQAKAYSSLREFLTHAAASQTPIGGMVLAKTLDVDRPEDLSQAQEFVRGFALPAAGGKP